MKANNSKECKDKTRELLPWYLNRTLSEDEAKKVEEHLEECLMCRRELEELRWLSSEIKELDETPVSPHIRSEKLVIFAEEPEKLSSEEITAVEKHLDSCPSCLKELQVLRSVNLELKTQEKKVGEKLAEEPSVFEKIAERLIWLVRKPTFAYIIVILLAYPAGRWLLGPSQPKMPAVFSEKVYMLSEQTRVPTEPTLVFRSDKDKTIRIGIPFWSDLDNYSYELVIRNERGESIFTIKEFTKFGDQGFSQLALDTDSFPDGRYILTIKEIDKEDPAISSEANFPFQIAKNQ